MVKMREALLATSMVAGFALTLAPSAMAQEAADESASARDSEIVVTGSRIARRDAIAESPIVTVTAEAITESGYVTVEQFLNTLPQVTANLSSQSNNPSGNGRAVVDLRGLGAGRNLVLIDGRRAMGSTSAGTVDLNTIPSALIERVEIITGGAATTYGADAVAGVVNFILKDDFEGFAVDSQYRLTEREDGKEWGGDVTYGGKFANGRGSAVFNASYFNREVIFKGAREFAAQASTSTSIFPGGSWEVGANTPTQAAVDAIFGADRCNTNGGQAGFGFNPDGTLFCTGVAGTNRDVVNYRGPQSDIARAFFPDFFSYNFEPDNILVLPLERWNLFSNFKLEINDHFRPFATAVYTNYNATQQLAPTPAGSTTGFTIPTNSPFLPAQLAQLAATRATPTAPIAIAKRFNALGGRVGSNNNDVFQITVGANGDIIDTWTYEVYASYGRSVLNEVQSGNVRRDRVQSLLNATTAGGTTGWNTVSGGACPNGLNLFGAAAIDPSCAAWISLEAKNLQTIQQNVVEATIGGELFQLPAGPVQTVFGAGYRDIDLNFQPDGGLQPGLVAGFNQQLPVKGKQDFFDVFTEVSVPLLKDLPFVQSLSLNAGYRISDNSITGQSDSWKVTGDWSVNDYLRFRGGVQTATRAPSIGELFAPQLNNFPNIAGQDPCNTTGAIAATYRNGPNAAQVRALCTAQSAVAGGANYVQPSSQATGITGGNPNLKPEEAESFTAGFVLGAPVESRWLDRFSLSVDYWSIDLESVIAAVGATTIIQRCFNRDNANPTYSLNNVWCNLFTRDPNNGGVINLQQLSRNQAFLSTSGVDVALNWGFDLDMIGISNGGSLDFNVLATWVEKYETQTSSADPVNDFVGTIGSLTGSATPDWRATLQTTYSRDALQLQLTTRWINGMIHANRVTGGSPVSNTSVPTTYYVDLTGQYDLTNRVTLRAGVNNLLDQDPRLYTPNVQANTDPSTYDVLGRRFFVGLNLRL